MLNPENPQQAEQAVSRPELPKTNKPTDVSTLLSDLTGGQFQQMLAIALTEAGIAAVQSESGKAKIKIVLDIERISKSPNMGRECNLKHAIEYCLPTVLGEKSEKSRTSTIVYVNPHGNMTVIPEAQQQLQFSNNSHRN